MHSDLTKGNVFKCLILFMIPLIIGNVFQQAYSLVDAIIVGKTLGDAAFSGVSCTGSASFLVIGFANGLTCGLCVPTSQFYGAKDYDKLRKSVATSFILCLIINLILTIIAVVSCVPLLKLLNTSDTLMPYASSYLYTIFLGIGATIFYNIVCFILRAIGDSKTPLYALIIASVINIGLDFLFIKGFKMGTEGAGYATIISQLLSGLFCFAYMFIRYPFLRLKKDDFKMKWSFSMQHLRIALPMAFQYSIIAIGLMFQQKAVNTLDLKNNQIEGAFKDLYATSYSAAYKIDNFGLNIIAALGTTMSTYCGQNYGARNLKRIKKGLLYGTIIGFVMSISLAGIIIPFGGSFLPIFLNNINDDIRHNAQLFMNMQCIFYFLVTLIYIYRSSLQGLGESNITVLAGVIELVMRIVASLILAEFFGWIGICFSNQCAWIGADLVLIPATIYFMKKYNKQEKNNSFGVIK